MKGEKVLKANPKDELRQIGDVTLRGETILGHLNQTGLSAEYLESLIGALPTYLGNLYGHATYIDYDARIIFDDNNLIKAKEVAVMPEEPECNHGYVVRSRQGDYKYHCKECDERFTRHPKAPDPTPEPVLVNPGTVTTQQINYLQKFREGAITLAEVAQKTTMSLKELKDALEFTFPPVMTVQEESSISQADPVFHVVDVEPQRTSCPEQIEAVFGNINVNMVDLMKITETVFQDVTRVDHFHDQSINKMVVMVKFVDDTRQRVEVDESEWRTGSRPLKNVVSHNFCPKTGGFGFTVPALGEK